MRDRVPLPSTDHAKPERSKGVRYNKTKLVAFLNALLNQARSTNQSINRSIVDIGVYLLLFLLNFLVAMCPLFLSSRQVSARGMEPPVGGRVRAGACTDPRVQAVEGEGRVGVRRGRLRLHHRRHRESRGQLAFCV